MSETFVVAILNLSVFAMAAVICYGITFGLRSVSYRLDLLDYPSERKIHKAPMPFLGGLGLFISFWFVVFTGFLFCVVLGPRLSITQWGHSYQILQGALAIFPKILWIFIGSLIIWSVGILDDKFLWSPIKKLIGQIVAAFILIDLGLTINLVSSLGFLGYLATFIWILLIINAFNFIDSLDGHCAGIAFISCGIFFWITQIIDQTLVGFFLVAFAGSLFGFLPHNFKPAKIFLGDNGSLLIGYMMAAFTLLCRYQSPQTPHLITVFIPVLVFGVPIYDTLSVVAVRLLRGQAPWKGDRNHFAHRLVKIGMSDKVAVVFSYFIAFTLGHVALLMTQVDWFGVFIIAIIFMSIIGMIAFLEFYIAQRAKISESLAKENRRRREDIRGFENDVF